MIWGGEIGKRAVLSRQLSLRRLWRFESFPRSLMGASWLRLGKDVISCRTVWVFTAKRSKFLFDNSNVIPFPGNSAVSYENVALAA